MTSEPSSTQFKLLLKAVEDNNISTKELVVQLYGLLREGGFSISEMIQHFQSRNPEFQTTAEEDDGYCTGCGTGDVKYTECGGDPKANLCEDCFT